MRRSTRIRWRSGPALLIAALTASLVGAIPAAAASTIVVDDDGQAAVGDCDASASAPASIQAAVDLAGPGATIVVCPGSYKELVTVGTGKDGLTIAAAQPFAAKVRVPQNVTADALVAIDGADDVTVRGLTLLGGDSKSCGQVTTGILVRDALRAVIRGNRMAPTAADTRSICGFPWGIAVGAAPARPAADVVPPASAFIGWNLVRDPILGGIQVAGEDTASTVRHNSIRYWHVTTTATRVVRRGALRPAGVSGPVGIRVSSGADAVIAANAVSSGPDADPYAGGVTPVGATASTPVLPLGIAVGSAGTVRVVDNTVLRVGVGLSVGDNASARITDNRLTTVRVGIAADDAGARYLRNTVATATVGITALRGGQILRDNAVVDASQLDCFDETTGDGTLGTGNTWSGNSGTVSYPVGICGSATPNIAVTFVVRMPLIGGGAPDPAFVVGTFTPVPWTPVPLVADGSGAWRATVYLPLGGMYEYHYRNEFGIDENECGPALERQLTVVNQGGLRMTLEDVFDRDLGLSIAVC